MPLRDAWQQVISGGGRAQFAMARRAAKSPRVWQEEVRKLVAVMALLAVMAGLVALTLARLAPALPAEDLQLLKGFPPRSISDLVQQRDLLLRYSARHPLLVGAGLSTLYVTQQAFAVPGTLALSVLAGALYGVRRGWLLVAGALRALLRCHGRETR